MTLIKKINNLQHRFFLKLGVYSLSLSKSNMDVFPDNFKFEEISQDTYLDKVLEYQGNLVGIDSHSLKQKLSNKRKLFFIIYNDCLAGYCHVDFEYINEPASFYKKKLQKDEIYFFKDFVFPEYRGLSLQKYSILKRIEFSIRNHKKLAYVTIYEDNHISKKSYTKYGFEKSLIWRCVKFMNFVWTKTIPVEKN